MVRHKQLSPGDELVIGEHAFTLELELPEAEPSLTGSLPAVKPPMDKAVMTIGALVVVLVMAVAAWFLGSA